MEESTVDKMAAAFRRVLSEGLPGDESNRTILIKRIPIICNDILQMKTDLRWIRWFVMGMAGGIGMVAIFLLTNHK